MFKKDSITCRVPANCGTMQRHLLVRIEAKTLPGPELFTCGHQCFAGTRFVVSQMVFKSPLKNTCL